MNLLHLLPALCLLSLAPVCESGQDQENILVLVVDDMGIDKSRPYGFQGADGEPIAARTPNIDRLAAQGMMFQTAWAAPACSTCRASALTGKYPNRTGVGSHIPADQLNASGMRSDELTIPDILPSHYASAVIGKWHLSGTNFQGGVDGGLDHAPRCGFDLHVGSKGNLGDDPIVFFDWVQIVSLLADLAATQTLNLVGEYATTRVTDDALRVIQGMGDRPFFMWVGYHAPHKPFHVPPAHLIQSADLDLTTDLGKAHAMIEALDTEIGRLFSSMDPEVLARTTVFWFSDNGSQREVVQPPFDPQKVKATVYNGGIQVPFFVRGRRIPPQHRGSICDRMIDITDLMPTVAEMLHVPVPGGIDGVSFLPYLAKPATPTIRPWIYGERFAPNFLASPGGTISQESLRDHDQAARGERYKLLRLRRWNEFSGQLLSERFEFYDIEQDFLETQDLLDSQGNPPVDLQGEYDRLRAVLLQMAL